MRSEHRTRNRGWLFLLLVLLACGLGPVRAAGGAEIRVDILLSANDTPYLMAMKGFQQQLEKNGTSVNFVLHALNGEAARIPQALKQAGDGGSSLLCCFGTLALKGTAGSSAGIPAVAGMVLKKEHLLQYQGLPGVYLEFPPEIQLAWVKKVVPRARSVGVLFSPGENGAFLEAAETAAAKLGLRLEKARVASAKDLPAALQGLAKHVDVLWGINDTVAYNPETAREILGFSLKNRIPVIGPSTTWVKAGALAALDWDYADIGAQTAELAAKILAGGAGGGATVVPPRKKLQALNAKSAEFFKISLPPELLRESTLN